MIPPLFPIFMGLLNVVASRPEPIDFSSISIGGRRDRHNQMFFPSRNIDPGGDDFDELMTLPGLHRKINLDNENDEFEDWDEIESKMELDDMTPRKTITFGDIDGTSFDNLDEASRSMEELDNNRLNDLSKYLIKLLKQPVWEAPLVIVEEPEIPEESEDSDYETSDEIETRPPESKRSRGYRSYPYKRLRARARYISEYDTAYFCEPSRRDVFHLLVALHDVRKGKRRRAMRFCKRRRTAGALVTNIRFLGRK